MKPNDSEFIIVGKIGSSFGIHGWLKLRTYTESGEDIFNYKPWYLKTKGVWQAISLENHKVQADRIIIKISGIDDPESAKMLTGERIAIHRTQLPKLKKNEYYWSDLEGLNVVDLAGKSLGKVSYLLETGSNDVLVVKGQNGEHAIPFILDDVIKKIDLDSKTIIADWEII